MFDPLGRYPTASMNITSPLFCVIIGLLCGVISGFGIGGGSILMIWMTAVIQMDQITAQGINLLYFIPTAAAAILFHARKNNIARNAILPSVVGGCLTAGIFAWFSSSMNTAVLRKLFGGFLIIIRISELLRKKGKGQK